MKAVMMGASDDDAKDLTAEFAVHMENYGNMVTRFVGNMKSQILKTSWMIRDGLRLR